MKLNWLGAHRDIFGNYYRSANGYSQICKTEMFGDKIHFSPYEVQIIEHIMEHGEENHNMKWYAEQLGLSQATYSKYVTRLVHKGLIEKFHAENNKKNVILRVSTQGVEEYEKYAQMMYSDHFAPLLQHLDSLTPDQLQAVRTAFAFLGEFHREFMSDNSQPCAVRLIKIR